MLASLLKRAAPGPCASTSTSRQTTRPCSPMHGPGRHRVEAQGFDLSLWTLTG
jgi:hypothetical protein